MSFTLKIVLALVGAAMIGGGAVYLVNVENKVVETQTPPVTVAAPVVKSREQLAAEYRAKAGSQQDLKPLDWGAKK